MVYRVFVEKKPGLDNEARELRRDARTFLGIKGLEKVRLLNRYDAERRRRSGCVRSVIPAGSVRPAGGFRGAVHPVHLPG